MVVRNAVFQAAETIKNPLRGAICASSGFQPVEKVQKDFFDRLKAARGAAFSRCFAAQWGGDGYSSPPVTISSLARKTSMVISTPRRYA